MLVSGGEIRPEALQGSLRQRFIVIVQVKNRGEIDPAEVTLLLRFPEREPEDNPSREGPSVAAERCRGEEQGGPPCERADDLGPRRSGSVVRLIN